MAFFNSSNMSIRSESNMSATNKPFGEYVYEVDADVQCFVPKVNPDPPVEPSQEYKELLAFEKELLSTTFYCSDCGSDAHPSGLCKQNDAVYSDLNLDSADNITQREQTARQMLSKGVPLGAPTCHFHAEQNVTLLLQPAIPHDSMPGAADGLIAQTALLPMCRACLQRQTGHTKPPPYEYLDTCLCASAITNSGCWQCAIGRCEVTKLMKAHSLTQMSNDGRYRAVVTCHCGELVTELGVRRCAACEGVVTLPAKNFAGDILLLDADSLHPQAMKMLAPPQNASSSTSGYKSIRDMLKENKSNQQTAVKPTPSVTRNHVVVTAAQISRLKGCGLNINGPLYDTDVQVAVNPRLCLNKVVKSLEQPFPALTSSAISVVLSTCGFDVGTSTDIMSTLNGRFEGKCRADNLSVLVSSALDSFAQPDPALTGWMDTDKDTEMEDAE